jgi:hypothetical protein
MQLSEVVVQLRQVAAGPLAPFLSRLQYPVEQSHELLIRAVSRVRPETTGYCASQDQTVRHAYIF